ncbi:hypothetical protein GALMADRAFT_66873 [Galerina marginata CBS 339.88]|uniref:Uncharacterized protein n=1 Tax=Galerina marginata (strain CBS 339.88) TaxID=685588 RepID=A0A067T072_GALM3|nr:hypothetical protein GALMADRAFT_66873 [Galerina marginata CBS 339.88]
MTRRKWTTPEQGDWLKEQLSAFVEAQTTKTTATTFFPQVIKDWRQKWPTEAPTAKEIADAPNLDAAIKQKKDKEDERIKTWFHNHTRGSTSGTGTRGVLKITQSRLKQEWQVYQLMTYESKWKAVIDNEWETYKKKWEEDHAGTKLPQGRFAFMNTFLKTKYNEESEEVKAEVRTRRSAMKEEVEKTQEQNEAYQKSVKFHIHSKRSLSLFFSAIDKLPRTLAVMGESIFKQTGWFVTFLVGGPAPRQNGKIMTYM